MTNGEDMGQGSGKDIPPWLQPVPEDEENGTQVTSNKLLIATIVGAVVIISLFGSVIWYLYEGTSSQPPISVAAPKEAIKEKPADAGGMEVAHQDKEIFNQSSGVQPRDRVSLGAQPEAPVTEIPEDPVGDAIEAAVSELEPKSDAGNATVEDKSAALIKNTATPDKSEAAAESTAENATTAEPVVEEPQPVLEKGFRVQLGAYGSEASAARAWRSVRGRFPDRFRDSSADFEAVQAGDRTLFRLRVGPYADRAAADQVCLALRSNEQACIVVNP